MTEPPEVMSNEEKVAAARITRFLDGWLAECQPFATTHPSRLAHYTDITGLMGVLGCNELWATNVSYLNDQTELLHSLLLLKRLIEDRAFAESHGLGDCTSAAADEVIRAILDHFIMYLDVFVVCFCESADLLSQWRGYGRRGGYAIEFNPAALAAKGTNPTARLSLVQVIYDGAEQCRRLALLVRRWREHFVDVAARDAIPGPWRIADLVFAEAFSMIAVAFKSHAFEEEREWRLVYRRSKVVPEDGLGLQVSFRSRDEMVLPYVGLPARLLGSETALLPAVGVTFGPTKYPDAAGYAVDQLARSLGYPKDFPVVRSVIPLRS